MTSPAMTYSSEEKNNCATARPALPQSEAQQQGEINHGRGRGMALHNGPAPRPSGPEGLPAPLAVRLARPKRPSTVW